MDVQELLAEVAALVWPDFGDLRCAEPAHPAGHVCLPVSDTADVDDLVATLDTRYGSPRTEGSGQAWLPCAEQIDWEFVWPFGGRWIAFGHLHEDDARPVLAVAERTTASPDRLPPEASWLDRLVAVTGWTSARTYPVDWTAVESQLGTPLPADYKTLVETFGEGQFDGFLDVYLPPDLIRSVPYGARPGPQPWEPQSWEPDSPLPAAGGLLRWASNEHEQAFYWIIDGPDPDRWPVYATNDDGEADSRFDCTATEFLFHYLTDRRHPFSIPVEFAAHWFLSYDDSSEPGSRPYVKA
ncbi:SMI1/KNR4 family protein [Streptomyces sp. NPDC001435]|uniref:SMI1/KNR4 family protein n=1 Tax=unclassified Streptomyces TaxID=2593676 RepID=UPI0036BEC37E